MRGTLQCSEAPRHEISNSTQMNEICRIRALGRQRSVGRPWPALVDEQQVSDGRQLPSVNGNAATEIGTGVLGNWIK